MADMLPSLTVFISHERRVTICSTSSRLSSLVVHGQRLYPVEMELDQDEVSPLYDEVFAADGCLEELIAFDNS